jgi:hypothetical protein
MFAFESVQKGGESGGGRGKMVRELHAGLVAMLLLSTCCCTPAFIHTVHRAGGRPCWHVAPRTRADAVATCRAARIAPGAAQRWVCLHNDSRRPPEEERFCLPHSRFEGRFVPVNEQMTFQAEMEALDALDEAESKLASQPDDFEAKFDENGDVTVGLFYRGSRGWSKKSVEGVRLSPTMSCAATCYVAQLSATYWLLTCDHPPITSAHAVE